MDELRRRAEALMDGQALDLAQLSSDAVQELFHELRVHQIELQMQNDELRKTQHELEHARKKYVHLYDFAPTGYCGVDRHGTIQELNLTFTHQVGATRAELLNTPFYLYIVEEDRDIFFLHLRKAFDHREAQSCELRLIRQDAPPFWARLESLVIQPEDDPTFPDGENRQVCRSTITNISKRKQTEEQFRTFFVNLHEYAYIISADGTILDANPAALQALGYERRELLGRPLTTIYAPESQRKVQQLFAKWQTDGSLRNEELVIVSKSGAKRTVLLNARSIRDSSGAILHSTSIQTDITERKQYENSLQEWASFANLNPSPVLSFNDKGIIMRVNPATHDILPQVQLEGRALQDIFPEIDGTLFLHTIQNDSSATFGYAFWGMDYYFTINGVRHLQMGYVYGSDISELTEKEKQLRSTTQRLKRVIETVGEGITLSNEGGNFVIFNSKMEEICGYYREEANTADDFLALLYPESNSLEEARARIRDLLNHKGEQNIETCIRSKNGVLKHLLVSTNILWEQSTPYFLSAYRDISRLKHFEEELEREARSKAELLREVNHRVGNNLMAISGLLSLERRHLSMEDHEAYQDILEDLSARINSLAKVHEMLSFSEWMPLALDELCREVLSLATQHVPSSKRVVLNIKPSIIRIGAKQAHNLALLMNELATNTIKYVLRDRETVRISIALMQEDKIVQLEFRDDGPGYPEDVLTLQRYNVGLDLLQRLSRGDLRGSFSLHNDAGAVSVIRFPDECT